MYIPKHFEETRVERLHGLIRQCPLAVLVTTGDSGLTANHIPFEIDAHPEPFGTLRGHVARANPVWRESSFEHDAMLIFRGADAYVSPSWYPSKEDGGKVVPTWNYTAVHAYGRLRIVEDAGWLRELVGRLTRRHEEPRPQPWQVSDAPDDYIEAMLRAIVGIEVEVTRLIGKWKVSQNRPSADRDGVIEGLRRENSDVARALANAVPPGETT